MFRMLVHPSSGACDLLWIYFMCCIALLSNHAVTPTHIEPEQYNPWNKTHSKSQAHEDGCTNIRNMLSSKWWNNKASYIKLVYLYSTIKMMHGPINLRFLQFRSLPICIPRNPVFTIFLYTFLFNQYVM